MWSINKRYIFKVVVNSDSHGGLFHLLVILIILMWWHWFAVDKLTRLNGAGNETAGILPID